MKSSLSKVLHPLADKPLIQHVLNTADALKPDSIHLVYGFGGEQVRNAIKKPNLQWVEQIQQLGTGHAVAQVMPQITDNAQVLILYGDVPLIALKTLKNLIAESHSNNLGILTVELSHPQGYGRIVRNARGQITCIVEEKDANSKIKQIQEVNTGILITGAKQLRRWLADLKNDNAQGEYYLTDVIAAAVAENIPIYSCAPADVHEVMGVNSRLQLAELERYYQLQQVKTLMESGVTVRDPARLDIRGTVQVAGDVDIDINVILEGKVTIGHNVKIGAHTIIKNAQIADNVEILSHCVIDDVVIGSGCRIGPFSRLRPDTVLEKEVRVGNFVEIKKSKVDKGSKISHLSYIGDSEIGQNVNIGAGTITCNYDGANKHKTIIKDNAFIGSDTQLVAPVTVEVGATIGAGSTITKNTPPNALSLSRAPQETRKDWKRPVKKSDSNP